MNEQHDLSADALPPEETGPAITPDNIEALIAACQEPEALKDLIPFAIQFEREDLLEQIVERTMHFNQLLKKLQDFELSEFKFQI
jgi:hypothetical protein